MSNVLDWKFLEKNVDPSAFSKTGDAAGARGNYVSSESIVLCAGPATLSETLQATMENLYPIGVCDAVQVMQNKGVIQLYEIGSRMPYIIPGRPITQFQISRVLFNGDSLLAAMTKGLWTNPDGPQPDSYDGQVMGPPGSDFSVNGNGTSPANFFLNLASQFFNNPIGLALFFKDSEDDWVAGFYAENCVIQQHSMAIQGQNMIVMENASVRCTTFVPMPGGQATG
jgi:hypothetical protein